MRKVIAAEFVSLDCFIAGTNGEMDCEPTAIDPSDLERRWDTILLGRVTYQLWLNFWPAAPKGENPQADFVNGAPKVVFSRTLETAPWGKWKSARLVKEGIPETIREMKEQPGRDMAILGSARLVQSFANLDLIDEYLLMVFPLLLGRGKPLFTDTDRRHSLKLIETAALEGGMVTLRYATAGGRTASSER